MHYMGPNIWNKLPCNLRQLHSLSAFKRNMNKYLRICCDFMHSNIHDAIHYSVVGVLKYRMLYGLSDNTALV